MKILVPLKNDLALERVRSKDWRQIEMNEVVWLNSDLSEMSAQIQEAEVSRGRKPSEIIFDDYIKVLSGPDGQYWFDIIYGRLPISDIELVQRITDCFGEILKSNADISGKPFVLYNHARGVWETEGQDGKNISGIISGFFIEINESLRVAEIIMRQFCDVVSPDPGPKPSAEASAAVKAAWHTADRARTENMKKIEKIEKFRTLLINGKYISVMKSLRTDLATSAKAWDSDMRWLILSDGVIDLDMVGKEELDLLDFDPKYMSTMAINTSFMDGVNYPDSDWSRGVAKVLPDPEVRRYLQMRFGAALLGTPGVVGKSMVWQFGDPDTAKSTLMECIAGEQGVFAAYSVTANATALTMNGEKNGESERFKAYARGKRFAIMDELDAGARLSQATLKTLTGGNTVIGTAKYANSVQYLFSATIFMASNDEPRFPPGDLAFRNRIHVVPFTHKLWVKSKHPLEWSRAKEEDRAEEGWKERILSNGYERSAILLWVLDGLHMYRMSGGVIDTPLAMREAAENFGSESDPVATIVRSLLGLEAGYENNPFIKIYSDTEWDEWGFVGKDALTMKEFDDLLVARAHELELLGFGENIPQTWKAAGRKMLNGMGGAKKRVNNGNGSTVWAFSRCVYTPAARSLRGLVGGLEKL